MTGKKRVEWLDAARGLGMLLVLAAHAMDRHIYLWNLITLFHMPLFYLISGYVYREKPPLSFIRGKLASIYLPYLVFGILIYFASVLSGEMKFRPNFLIKIIFMWKTPGLMGAAWFLGNLLYALLLYDLIGRLFRRAGGRMGIPMGIFSCLLGLCGFFLALPLHLARVLTAIFFLHAGFLMKNPPINPNPTTDKEIADERPPAMTSSEQGIPACGTSAKIPTAEDVLKKRMLQKGVCKKLASAAVCLAPVCIAASGCYSSFAYHTFTNLSVSIVCAFLGSAAVFLICQALDFANEISASSQRTATTWNPTDPGHILPDDRKHRYGRAVPFLLSHTIYDILIWAGKNTIGIVLLQFVSFRAVNLLIVLVHNLQIDAVCEIPVLYEFNSCFWQIIYILAGAVLSVLIYRVYEKIEMKVRSLLGASRGQVR